MIVINNLTNNSLPFIRILTFFFGNIYFHKTNINISNIKKFDKIKPLKFIHEDQFSNIPAYDLGNNRYINKYILDYLPSKFEKIFFKEFKGIINFKKKLEITFISSLSFEEIKTIYTLFKLRNSKHKLFLVHSNLDTFLCKSNGVKNDNDIVHYYIPFDDINKIIYTIKLITKKLPKFFIKILNYKRKPKLTKSFKKKQKVALIVHETLSYGKLYKKSHFFSEKIESPLHIKNILLLNRNIPKKQDESFIKYSALKASLSLKVLRNTITIFLTKIIYIRSMKEFYGFIFVVLFFLKYQMYINTFKNSEIKNIIYDFDILVSKPLSLALEYLNIKTFAFQERPNTVFGRVDGVIVDTYFTAGGLFNNFLKKNNSFIFNNAINLGNWKLIFFYKKDLIKFSDINFVNQGKHKISNFANKILFLGYYYNSLNNMPCTNQISIDNFLDLIINTADQNKQSAIILRMKILNKFDINYFLKKFAKRDNIFICDHYNNQAVSYRLCKESNLIISKITSLALESIVFGKKVILINNVYPFANMAKDLYPKDFNFAISENHKYFQEMIDKCLKNDHEINLEYLNLKNKLKGNFDLSKTNIIPDTIESLLI